MCCGQINAAMHNTRSNDSGPLKKAILSYIHPDMRPLNPPLVGVDLMNKTLRGFNHFQIGCLLMPIEYEPTREYVPL